MITNNNNNNDDADDEHDNNNNNNNEDEQKKRITNERFFAIYLHESCRLVCVRFAWVVCVVCVCARALPSQESRESPHTFHWPPYRTGLGPADWARLAGRWCLHAGGGQRRPDVPDRRRRHDDNRRTNEYVFNCLPLANESRTYRSPASSSSKWIGRARPEVVARVLPAASHARAPLGRAIEARNRLIALQSSSWCLLLAPAALGRATIIIVIHLLLPLSPPVDRLLSRGVPSMPGRGPAGSGSFFT
jgi:hypothetical protein